MIAPHSRERHSNRSHQPTSAFLLAVYSPSDQRRAQTTISSRPPAPAETWMSMSAGWTRTSTPRNRVFGRFSYWKLLSLAQDPFGTGFCKDRCAENTRSKSLAVGYTHTFSPTTIADFNISISRFHYLRLPINSGFDMTQEGWPAAYNGLVPDTERTPLTPCFAVSATPTSPAARGRAQSTISIPSGISPRRSHDSRAPHLRLGRAT